MTIHSPAELRVGDTVRVIPKPFVGTVQKLTSDDQVIVDGTWHHAGKFEFDLIDRPEPPKPAAKVGDVVSLDIAEPPLGSVVARTVSLVEPGSKVRVRMDGGWRLATDNDSMMYWDWQGLADMGIGYTVVFIPGE